MSDGLSDALGGSYFGGRKSKFFQYRITNDYITELKDNEIFTFGSNTKGRHGKGAAKTATKWGAIYGQGIGLQGQTYAIPTKGDSLEILPIDKIKMFIDEFIVFASKNKNMIFLVTSIGTGLSGYSPIDIAPLFKKSKHIPNIHLPEDFWNHISHLE